MRTNYVLIDLENVQVEALTALIDDHFKVLVFVGATQAKLPYDLVAAMQRLGDRAEYIKIAGTGPNALDFHIAFYIGQLSAKDPTAYFHVVSKDKGFDPLIKHLKSRKMFSARSSKIEDIPLIKASTKKSPEDRAQMFIDMLCQPKATRPRKESTLASAIASFFHKQISDEEVAAVIEALQAARFLMISAGKVTYTESG